MKLLVVNSNTTDSVSAPFGLPLIVSRADWLVAGPATLAALAQHRGRYDGAIIACFGDPGLDATKALLDVPVLGISEAACHAACMLGRRFGVVSFTAALRPMFEDCLEHHGLLQYPIRWNHLIGFLAVGSTRARSRDRSERIDRALAARCAGFRMGPPFSGDPGMVAEQRAELLVDLRRQSVEQDGAEAVILAGGPLAGLAPLIADRVAVPLVDGTVAAVRLAEALIGLAPPHARNPRPSLTLTGFPPEIAALFA